MSLPVLTLILGLTSVLGQVPTRGVSSAKTVDGRPNKSTDKACFAKIGCFDLSEPWSRNGQIPRPEEPNRDTTVLYFYSRRNPEKPYVLRTYPDIDIWGVPFDGRRPTAIIIHGYQQNATIEWIQTMKYFYLLNINSNVLIPDFSQTNEKSMAQSVSNSRIVGKLIARLLEILIIRKNLRPPSIHLIGHGLGAQIASYVAKKVPRISRLTALDPQQPFFEGHDSTIRLDKTDAAFVEVVHTNAIPYDVSYGNGMMKPHGHVDFYFNDGANQPGCLLPPGFPKIADSKDFFNLLTQYRKSKNLCNQNKAYDYLVEAYNSFSDCVFWGHKVETPPIADSTGQILWQGLFSLLPTKHPKISKSPPCTKDNCIPFGYHTIHYPLRGVFVIKTNPQRPYCLPEIGPSNYSVTKSTQSKTAE